MLNIDLVPGKLYFLNSVIIIIIICLGIKNWSKNVFDNISVVDVFPNAANTVIRNKLLYT